MSEYKIYLGTDHAAFNLKNTIKDHLIEKGMKVEDFGAYEFDPNDDFPPIISKVARAVSEDPESRRGIVLGGSGQGEGIVANKFRGIRAVVFKGSIYPTGNLEIDEQLRNSELESGKLALEHNNANIVSFGGRRFGEGEDDEHKRKLANQLVLDIIDVWLNNTFPGDERHVRRIKQITELEEELYK